MDSIILKQAQKRVDKVSQGRAKFALWVSIIFCLTGVMMAIDANNKIDLIAGVAISLFFGFNGLVSNRILALKKAVA